MDEEDPRIDPVAETIREHARRHRISNSPYGHVCPAECLAEAVLRKLDRLGLEVQRG